MAETKDDGLATQSLTVPSGPHRLPTELDLRVSLPTVVITATPGEAAEFEQGETIGEGGMGQVVSATQRSLQRPVALKFSRSEHGRELLLREAIATGRLEHPNIVPVHLLAKTIDGVPFFAMKRVEGTPWSEALTSSRTLVEHLETLVRVCDAVAFAHDRRVIHRDIKPSNVLLGRFGEVLLVDWGLAASLRPDTVLPLASQAGVGGTPAYMAPEMVDSPQQLGPWTDVYLLGATLHEVLAGRPPHEGASPAEAMQAALRSEPPAFGPKVPTELANICRRAMHRDIGSRFASVLDLKAALAGYLRHREAMDLYDAAKQQLTALERQLGAQPSLEQSMHGQSVHALFTECRFGLEQVRRLWPEFEGARDDLRRALVMMARSELERGSPRAARLLLSQVDSPPAELLAAIEAAERTERGQKLRLEALEQSAREASTEAARDPKARFARRFGLALMLSSLFTQGLETSRPGTLTTGFGVLFSSLAFVLSLLYGLFVRRAPDANLLQRRIAQGVLISSAGAASLWLIAWNSALPVLAALRLYFVLVAATWGTAAAIMERRGLLVASSFAVALIGSFLLPEFSFGIGGVCGGVGFWLLARSLERGAVAT